MLRFLCLTLISAAALGTAGSIVCTVIPLHSSGSCHRTTRGRTEFPLT